MQSLPRSFRQSARKPVSDAEVYLACDQVQRRPCGTVRRHGDKPNGGNRGRLRITSRKAN